ncbi:MAG: DNA polymerase I [Chloroflexi bacterium]|nr:DNA polymerase I [Chloroflexota bacterium]
MPPAANRKPRLVILDSHGILYRAFFAFANSDKPLMTSKGELTFATHGYAETLIRVLDQLQPTHICAAWDAAGKTFRHEASEAYKATRRETPSELLKQMARVRQLLDAFGIPIYECPGYEADDVAGTIARMAAENGVETYIATLDTDLVQLIKPGVNLFMFRPYQRDTVDYNETRAAERYGFSPIYMIDYKALKGDTSDNVEGIRGIGEKTATDLIRQFGTVEAIYERIDEVKGALKTKLIDGEETARRNKELVTIHTDVPVDFDMAACEVRGYDRDAVMSFFRELEFRMLAARLDEVLGSQPQTSAGSADEAVAQSYETVTTEPALRALAEALRAAGSFAFAALSTSGDTAHQLLLGLSFATAPGRAWYVPVGHAPRLDADTTQVTMDQVRATLGPLLADPAIGKTTYGTKHLMHQLAAAGMTLDGAGFDVTIAAFLLGETSSTLSALVNERLGLEMPALTTLTGSGRNAVALSQVEIERVQDYACQHADMLLRVRPHLEAQLHERGQWPLFADMELPLIPVLYRMEREGVALDIAVLRDLARGMSADIERGEREIYALVGHEFNIGSPQQLSDVLFKEMGLPKTRKTTQGYSTDQRALESLRAVTPLIDKIFEYRELTKLKSTYLDALPMTVAEDGRIHTDFQQTVAATGRLSSKNPNLQNIPVRTDTGRDIRKAFVAARFDDPWFVAADYSQVELRVLAHVTGDRGLVAAFLADQDIHRATAATVYGVQPEEVTRQMRDTAKMVNFGIAYGMGEFGLASRTGMSREEADAFIKSYFASFPGIAEWQQQTLKFTRDHGYAETVFGRRRYLPAIHSTNFQVRSAAEREAINMPIQGSAADIIKVAMIRVDAEIGDRGLRSRMILQVHDELIFECPAEEIEAVSEIALRLMPASLEMNVPLKVDVKKGKNWGEVQ